MFKKALKDETFRGYANLVVVPGQATRFLNTRNAGKAFEWFGEMSATWLDQQLISDPVIIPIPSSKCTLKTSESRTRRLAEALQKRSGGDVLDVLRFNRESESTRNGGSRAPEDIYPMYRLVSAVPSGRPIVLVDDVLTSGGHIRAAVAYLTRKGIRWPEIVACCGVSAEREPSATPFDRNIRVLDDYVDSRRPG
jgi:predicted amidophosphoribosyltransferase